MDVPTDEVLTLFRTAGAVLEGHFALTSGQHSSHYIQTSLVLGQHRYAQHLGATLAERFRTSGATCVVGPALGAVVLAYEVARHLDVPAYFAERVQGVMRLGRGHPIGPKSQVLVVEDAVITGSSVRELLEIIRQSGAEPVGVGALFVWAGENLDFGVPLVTLSRPAFPMYPAEQCPLCQQGIPLVRPRHGRA